MVRIVDRNGRALAERVSEDYTRLGLVNAMVEALEQTQREIPDYLRLLQAEFTAESRATDGAVFAMACFWADESRLVPRPATRRRSPLAGIGELGP